MLYAKVVTYFGSPFNNDDMSTISLREELPQFLRKNNLLCDYVFCTGDIRTANANPNTFTDEAAKYLIDLCAAVGLTTDRLFIVPEIMMWIEIRMGEMVR